MAGSPPIADALADTGAWEKRIIDAGGDHHLTLVRFEELSRISDRLPVVSDVVEEIQHDLVNARASQ
jgi:hypothetical protein